MSVNLPPNDPSLNAAYGSSSSNTPQQQFINSLEQQYATFANDLNNGSLDQMLSAAGSLQQFLENPGNQSFVPAKLRPLLEQTLNTIKDFTSNPSPTIADAQTVNNQIGQFVTALRT